MKSFLKILGGLIITTIGTIIMMDGATDGDDVSFGDVEDDYYDDFYLYED